jgi:hypothetical protein
MQHLWMTAHYLAAATHRRVSALTRTRDAGALSLEWIVIAGIVFAAAVAAGIVFNNAISAETAKLP